VSNESENRFWLLGFLEIVLIFSYNLLNLDQKIDGPTIVKAKKRRQVKISLAALKEAFNFSSDDVTHYLNVEEGKIAMHSNFGGAFDEDGNLIREIDAFNKKKYVEIPGVLYFEAYKDMDRFTKSVEDENLRRKLITAVAGKGAFRRFTYILLDYPQEREQWVDFQEAQIRKRIFDWLEENNLELVE